VEDRCKHERERYGVGDERDSGGGVGGKRNRRGGGVRNHEEAPH
jgi:hypothetical protein